MTVHLPEIGFTDCIRAISLLEEYTKNILGSFWVMCGRGFNDIPIPEWWTNNAVFETDAQGIINAFETGGAVRQNVCLGFCIIVVADFSNPAHLSYFIQHLRMCEAEGLYLLRIDDLYSDPLLKEKFYPLKTEYGDYGEEKEIEVFQKMKFCTWMCEERRKAEDFVDFKIIIDFIKDCLGTVTY